MAFEMFEIKEQSVRWVDLGSIALNPAHHSLGAVNICRL